MFCIPNASGQPGTIGSISGNKDSYVVAIYNCPPIAGGGTAVGADTVKLGDVTESI